MSGELHYQRISSDITPSPKTYEKADEKDRPVPREKVTCVATLTNISQEKKSAMARRITELGSSDPRDKGIDSLAALCKGQLDQDPLSGVMFVFRNRPGTALKVLTYDSILSAVMISANNSS